MRINKLEIYNDFDTTGLTNITGMTESVDSGSTHYELPTAKAVYDVSTGAALFEAGSGTDSIQSTLNGCDASGNYSVAIGNYAYATNTNSLAMGVYTLSNGSSSFAGGKGANTTYPIIANGVSSFNHSFRTNGTTDVSGSTGDYSAILGGKDNSVNGDSSAIIGGNINTITNETSGILAGNDNTITNKKSAIIGGGGNTLNGNSSAIIGGNNITGSQDDTVYVPSIITVAKSAAPSSPEDGQIYYDSSARHFYGRVNGTWKQLDN